MTELQTQLVALADPAYKAFHSGLLPTVDPDTILGVRMPVFRKFARGFAKSGEAGAFLQTLPHRYYEENNLHMQLIVWQRDFARTVELLDAFLTYVDNWATCDFPAPQAFAGRQAELLPHIDRWLADPHPYTKRYAVGLLLRLYLDEAFTPDILARAAAVPPGEYYVDMMVAWFFATALAMQYDAALPYLQQRRLPVWTHNKTIQKAIESYRITPEQKSYLRTLRIRRTR